MATLTYRTAGESHGPALIALIEGMPAGVPVDKSFIDNELRRRQGGYGRGGRQKIEVDTAEFLTGVRRGKTIASPVTMLVKNKDSRLDDLAATPPLHRPRPGHADLAGSLKWLTTDCRETLERASARETAARVAAGALARCLLRQFDIEVIGFVREVGPVRATIPQIDGLTSNGAAKLIREIALTGSQKFADEICALRDADDLYCPDAASSERMKDFIRKMKGDKDTAGGVVECLVLGCPIGVGSCMTWDGRLDSRIAGAVMGIQAFKGVEIGWGFECARHPGSQVHDEIFYDESLRDTPMLGFSRDSNRAGGLEGGMTNGQPIVVRGAMKPISTLGKPLRSVDLNTKQPSEAGWERSDISAISAAGVVMENVIAFEVARAMLEKFGGDSLIEMKANYQAFLDAARKLPFEPQG